MIDMLYLYYLNMQASYESMNYHKSNFFEKGYLLTMDFFKNYL